MFPIFHERTRRFICRTGFLLFGLLPTAAVVAWSASFNSASNIVEVRERLESETGLKVTFDEVRFTRPGGMLLESFALADPETGAALVRARLLEITTTENQRHVRASQPTVEAAAIGRMWPLVEKCLRRPPHSKQPNLNFEAAELTLNWPGGSQTLIGCRLNLDTSEHGSTATLTCQIAHPSASQTCQLRLDRQLHFGQPTTSFSLDTGEANLPCALLVSMFSYENRLGPNSAFAGTIQGMEGPAGWRVGCEGKLTAVDLQSAISDQFPQQLRGPAEITALKTEFHSGRLETATGRLRAGPGFVGRSLLIAASACLGMRCNPSDLQPAAPIAYEKLDVSFEISPKGLTINGKCGERGTGEVMRTKEGKVLVQESQRSPVPVVSLVQMLVPDSQVQVPATRQTDWLLRLLPLPDVLPRDPQATPQARLQDSRAL
jgi:hypothetical protein